MSCHYINHTQPATSLQMVPLFMLILACSHSLMFTLTAYNVRQTLSQFSPECTYSSHHATGLRLRAVSMRYPLAAGG